MAGDGVLSESKVSTTPDDPSRAVVAGLAALLEELGLDPGDVEEVLHGTTVGSNTLLQRSGAGPVSSPPAASATCWRSAASACPTCST